MRKADFFIVGAPKCGTTAMYEYLAQHPEIFVPSRKEIQFFGTDLYAPRFPRDPKYYESLFLGATTERRIGEASVWYLYSKRAAREIREYNPAASIIIMLRNPVDMIHALHSERLYIGTEDIENFQDAVDAEDDRKLGLRLPADPYPIEGLFYHEVGKYTDQVQRFIDVFGWERSKVIIYDDFRADPAEAYRQTCKFLNVDQSFIPAIRVVNPNKKIRSKGLRNFLNSPSPLLTKIGKPLTTRPLRHAVLNKLRRLNTNYVPREALSAELKSRLQAHFASDVERLSELLGRDLTVWSNSSQNEPESRNRTPLGASVSVTETP